MKSVRFQCEAAKLASKQVAHLSTNVKNDALNAMARALIHHTPTILSENDRDLTTNPTLTDSLRDRLRLTADRIADMANSLHKMADLRDPCGEIVGGWTQPNGLQIQKVRIPLGVIAVIYEARPNVTADAIGIAIKTGNSIVLRGSSSATCSNRIITTILTDAAVTAGIPPEAIQLLEDGSRSGVTQLVKMNGLVDVVIPRGGAELIRSVIATATIPTIETGVGNCHLYVDQSTDLSMALSVIINAKISRPSVCNSCETVLVHSSHLAWTSILGEALQKLGCEIRACDAVLPHIPGSIPANDSDWETEFLDLIIAIKSVESVDAAIDHINRYGSHHSDGILSSDWPSIQKFTTQVDSAAVLVNASTRFVDGGEFGFGAEMGISTQKLLPRGPMGLPELTTIKYIVVGTGHIR